LASSLLLALAVAVPGIAAQSRESQGLRRIVSSEISVSRTEATLTIGLAGGGSAEFAIRDGRAFVDGREAGEAPRGGDLDRSWRELLARAMDAPTDQLARLLVEWQAPGRPAIDAALEQTLTGADVAPALAATPQAPTPAAAVPPDEMSDSMTRLVERITELQQELEDVRIDPDINIDIPGRDRGGFGGPFRHLIRGLSDIFSTLILYAVLFGIAFATIFFGGRRFIEGVADTARAAPTRSLLVGLCGFFLVVPAFILGIVALAISIIGIPALLLWIPLFPVAVGLSVLLGYISVAHAAGEALAERRFYGADWFQRGNSYYFIGTGLALLLSLFIASHVVQMAGPWLGFLRSMLTGLGFVMTTAVLSIGLGAVLLSRAGTRPIRRPRMAEPDVYAEATNA
jgi:hypothetical protein